MAGVRVAGLSYFNPHSPCGERPAGQTILEGLVEFQSTLPLRGATSPKSFTLVSLEFQSTLPLRGATGSLVEPVVGHFISIHTPLAGSD